MRSITITITAPKSSINLNQKHLVHYTPPDCFNSKQYNLIQSCGYLVVSNKPIRQHYWSASSKA